MNDETLSVGGEARRRHILAGALRAADRRRHKRLAVRAGAGVGVACVLVAAAALSLRRTPPAPAPTIVIEHQQTRPATNGDGGRSIVVVRPASKPAPIVTVEIIRHDPSRPTWEVLDDEQFLAALADAGRPAGLARVNGVTTIVRQ